MPPLISDDPRQWQPVIIAIVNILATGTATPVTPQHEEAFRTASALAELDMLATPLGHLIYHDAMTHSHSGWTEIARSVRSQHGRSGQRMSEASWLRHFLAGRTAWIDSQAAASTAAGDAVAEARWNASQRRVEGLQGLLDAGNLTLTGSLNIQGQIIPGIGEDAGGDIPGPMSLPSDAEAAGFSGEPDLNQPLPPGTPFKATWRFMNNGESTWDGRFTFAHSDRFVASTTGYPNTSLGAAKESYVLTEIGAGNGIDPGGSVALTLEMKTPDTPGMHASHWQLVDQDGRPFGPVRWVAIQVKDPIDEVTTDELVYSGPSWSYGRCLVGIHDRADRHPQPSDHAYAGRRFETVKVQTGVTVEEMTGYKPKEDFYFCRLFHSWGGRFQTVEDFLNSVTPDMERLVNGGVKYFEFHNEPNLTSEGLRTASINGSWSNGAEFADFFIEGRRRLMLRYPTIKVGFPGLSPGGSTAYQFGHDSGFRMDSNEFLRQSRPAIEAADFLCVHAYYGNVDELRGDTMEWIRHHRRHYPDKLLFITEVSNPLPGVSGAIKGGQAREFFRDIQHIPGVGAAYYFIVSGPGWDEQALRTASGQSTGFVEAFFS